MSGAEDRDGDAPGGELTRATRRDLADEIARDRRGERLRVTAGLAGAVLAVVVVLLLAGVR
ncbi:hypothetical protein [Cellulomonas sp. KH9]|uniref:hypothetical protein n=1 Tax=Cellulomonas sp. KH9 TaxID=1855324 RepID=UPI0008EB7F3C|nr:hypothetical protein [Cellulomonas sp. KH9]SFK29882.1 hypothetical protein SAMN05216467_2749 [Cellulomonas sp. KH9]